MKRFLLALLSLAWLLSVGGCAIVRSESAARILMQVDDIATGAEQTLPAIVEIDGQPALLYATKDNRINFQYGERRTQLDETARVRGGNRFQLHRQDQNLHALWWSHQDGKNLYFTTSGDSGQRFNPVGVVNDAHGVLPPFNLLRGPEGAVGISYQDERSPRYQAYFNRSTDYGRTWPKPDFRLDTPPAEGKPSAVQDPISVESGSAWVTAWVDAVNVEGRVSFRIVSRRSDDAGLVWSPPEVLHTSDKLISSLTVRAQGNNIVIAADEHERGILTFASKDQGRNWRGSGILAGTGVPEGTAGANNSGIRMDLADGRAHLLWMEERIGAKTRIMRGSLDIAQARWIDAAQRLDIKTHDTTRSLLPTVLALPLGPVLAAWVDYRDIRPNIYLSASFDQGQTWSAPQALLNPGEVSTGWPRLMPWRDQVAIAYDAYPNDRARDGKFVLRLIPIDKSATALADLVKPSQVSEAERKAKLEQRVKTLWANRVAGDYERAYDLFDFAYRAATTKKNYLDNVGVIDYQAFSLEDIAITGNEAVVKMKIKYEIKSTMMPNGRTIKVAPVEVEAANSWVWVGNDWYMVYSPSFDQPNLKY